MSSAPSQNHFLRLFLANERDLRAFLSAAVRDAASQEDVFQETAVSLWKAFEKYDPARPFGPWARGVALNKVRQYRRRIFRGPLVLPEEALLAVAAIFDETPDPADAEDNEERIQALESCLQELPTRSAKLLDFRYRDALSAPEIATRTGQSPHVIYQTLSRLRRALEVCIRRRLARQDQPARLS